MPARCRARFRNRIAYIDGFGRVLFEPGKIRREYNSDLYHPSAKVQISHAMRRPAVRQTLVAVPLTLPYSLDK